MGSSTARSEMLLFCPVFPPKSCISSQNLYFLPQIIFVVGGVKESYSNLRTLFALLDLKASKNCKIVMDLKCANLALGLQTARAR